MVGAVILVLLEVGVMLAFGCLPGALCHWLTLATWWRVPLWLLLIWVPLRFVQDLLESIVDYQGLAADFEVTPIDYWPRAAAGLLTYLAVVILVCFFLFP